MRPGSGAKATPGLTLRSLFRQRERSGAEFDSRHLLVPRDIYELTLASRPASPGTINPSRNRSPPVELCFGDLSCGRSIATAQVYRRYKAAAARLIPCRRRTSAGPTGIRRHFARYFSDSTSSLITLLTGFLQSSPCRALAPP